MSKTQDNLKEAFAGESQANRKYLAFAAAADKEGFAQAARLFRAAAEAETVHALNHLRVMGGIKSTKENLQEAINGETHEFTSMYPEMITAAEAEGNKDAKKSFNYANTVEKIHAGLYDKMLKSLDKKENFPYWICPVCGNTFENEGPDACPICFTKKAMFKKIE
ncbi:MAG: rubrerythrin [Chloroflexi bacterium RBG_16_48_7]|nr:MAG: rubrerythrin [Chloroflexi bacterium RBG_16_48_7]